MTRARVAVLASGGGSNLQALLDYLTSLGDDRAADVVLVASDQPGARALSRAKDAGIATGIIASRSAPDGESLAELLARHELDLIVLAGYLRLVPAEVTRRFAGRVINVHPAPLPAFGGAGMYGVRAHRAVLAAGATSSGPTVHFVDEEYDRGPTIAHWPVPVLPGDDEHSLAARVLRAEHLLFPRVVQAVAAGDVSLDANGRVSPANAFDPLTAFDSSLDDRQLAAQLDHAHTREQH